LINTVLKKHGLYPHHVENIVINIRVIKHTPRFESSTVAIHGLSLEDVNFLLQNLDKEKVKDLFD
jgi:hypothetical protein